MTNQSVQEIIDERKLIRAPRDMGNNILTKLKDIEQYTETFQVQGDQIRTSAIATETARHVAQVLRDEKSFVDPKELKALLDQSRQEVELRIDVLREDIEEKTEFYQTSIDATNERLQKHVEEAHKMLKKENKNFCNHLVHLIQEQFKQTEQRLEDQMMAHRNTIEQQLKSNCQQMQKIIQAAEANANQALKCANEAIQSSKHASRYVREARDEAKKLVESTEQRRLELQSAIEKCEMKVKQTIVEQKDFCERSMIAARTEVQQDLKRAQAEAKQAAVSAQESAQVGQEIATATQAIQEAARKQLKQQKEERNQILSHSETMTKQNERAANESKEAVKQTKQTADALIAALKRIDELERKMKHILERSEKF